MGRIALLLLLGLAACNRPKMQPKPPVAVRVETVATTTQASTARYSGTVLAQTQVDLAFKVGGYVATLATMRTMGDKHKGRPLQAGDHVSRDTVLASLRKEDFKRRYAE